MLSNTHRRITMAECIISGRQGPKGDQGEQGPQGATGSQGPTGPSGSIKVYDSDANISGPYINFEYVYGESRPTLVYANGNSTGYFKLKL